MLHILISKKIPVYLVSCTLGSNSKVLLLTKLPFFNILKKINGVFTQSNKDQRFLKSVGMQEVIHAGDTRIDRVMDIANIQSKDAVMEEFINEELPIFICGSTHPKDEKWIIPILQKSAYQKIIIAPHHTDTSNIKRLQSLVGQNHALYTDAHIDANKRWLIVNTIGRLSQLYSYAEKAYIGGGFGSGVHNTLEPAVQGVPMAIGPHSDHFREVQELASLGVITIVRDQQSLSSFVNEEISDLQKQKILQSTEAYFEENQGATHLVYETILNHLNP